MVRRLGYALATGVLGFTVVLTGCSEKNEAVDNQPAENKGAVEQNESLTAATDAYKTYVIEQTDLFVQSTEQFVDAVKTGDVKKAQELYAPTRMFYERIEPIAESFGDLDPNLDAREGDVDDKEWRGFHRIEKSLWIDQQTAGQEGYADQLLSDSKLLRALVETVEVSPDVLISGAVGLLNEVSSSKVVGEEERYSHTDLYDFAANVEGAEKIFELLKPELEKKDAALASDIKGKFEELDKDLSQYKVGDGYMIYTDLKQEQTKKLSQLIDALAEPLSQMGTVLEA
ncbi:iron uptake system protein EfeO [Paenibacillus spongiae]|uniref:EfeM/EfeO family lipoprotein n=1 Tax=Paenibacillus spongiae TaxID=2909671 RepID=A0ABY5SGY3_9BACL|nr:iron uptake system protein EfeO [Paenibacillus spongiae]UVI33261.1 EfeM/EfeO family lipoprotein [Paenibacillus spongiae]